MKLLIIGFILGIAFPFILDYILFGTIDPVTCTLK